MRTLVCVDTSVPRNVPFLDRVVLGTAGCCVLHNISIPYAKQSSDISSTIKQVTVIVTLLYGVVPSLTIIAPQIKPIINKNDPIKSSLLTPQKMVKILTLKV